MTERAIVHLPDLTGSTNAASARGWASLLAEQVAVPSPDDARACARAHQGVSADPCVPRVVAFDPPDGTTFIGFSGGDATVRVHVSPGFPADVVPILTLHPVDPTGADVQIAGQVQGASRDWLVFPAVLTATTPHGDYALSVGGYPDTSVRITVTTPSGAPAGAPDRCALQLAPGSAPVAPTFPFPPGAAWPAPPLLAVDHDGCIVPAWSVDERGRVLVPRADGGVDLQPSCRGGLIATLSVGQPIRDAIFWKHAVAVLTATAVLLFDLSGCALTPSPFAGSLVDAVALAISDQGDLVVVERSLPNVLVFRRDGSRVAPPAAFDARGWYARHRSPAFTFDPAGCGYEIDPARAGEGCCVSPARALTDDEARLFRLIDDLPGLRQRVAYPPSGWAILGPGAPEDALDAGRPGTQWHRVVLFGEIPDGCAVQIETRASDDILAGDPFVAGGWSAPVTAGIAAAGPVDAPDDTRTAAADAMILAGPGRYLWMRLTLLSNGAATPRLTSIELERPREGTARLLPKIYRDSTPDDDFLRRWLALFEATAWDGVARRMDGYPELFDPRTAPVAMLAYLAGWLELPVAFRLRSDPDRLREILLHADEIARARGTIDGLILIVRLYMGFTIHVVESFRTRSGFVLGCGVDLGGVTGPVLGCDTILTREPAPTTLGDWPRLGSSFLLDCDERTGTIPGHFEVWVPARDVCKSEDLALLRMLIDAEKPASATYGIRQAAPAGWVVGVGSVVGQEVSGAFDRHTLDPATYGIALLNGPPRPRPIGEGFMLGFDSRLPAAGGQPEFRLDATVGKTTRLGA